MGLFTRSSSVTYLVRIHLRDVALLPAVLDAIAGAKNATLSNLIWDYDGSYPEENALLGRCAARAHEKARALAEAVGSRLGDVHSIREKRIDEVTPSMAPMGVPPAMKRRASTIQTELAGLDLAPKKRVSVQVVLECRLLPTTSE